MEFENYKVNPEPAIHDFCRLFLLSAFVLRWPILHTIMDPDQTAP